MARSLFRTAALSALLLAGVAEAQAPARTPGPAAWPVRTREYYDLWLHGFAMVSGDGPLVPLFRRGYRDAMTAARRAANVTTELDANHDLLAGALASNAALVNAQFLPLYFGSWAELDATIDQYLRAADGDRKARDDRDGRMAIVAGAFPTKGDREFARRLLQSLRAERDRFHHEWWLAETRRREPVVAAVDSLWRATYFPALRPFLNRSQQRDGDFVLSLALEGEGRTTAAAGQRTTVTVGLPASVAAADDAIFAFAHEVVGTIVAASIADNVTPAEQRAGVAADLASAATVRAGALLIAHVSDEAARRYERFYLRVAGVDGGGDAHAAFVKTFPVPAPIIESIGRQIAVTFSGI